jgi:kynureninase
VDAIDDTTALVALTHVHYASARRWDMAAVTAAAHARGALAFWDLSHTAGAIQCDLNGCDADLAVGCGYKHLNGGPGAPAFLYVAERHQTQIRSPLSGWMGHAEPFAFEPRFRPAPDIRAQLCGTPPILGLAALECGLDVLLQADPAAAEAKGLALCELFIRLVAEHCAGHDLRLVGPRDMAERGLHVSFAHPDAYAIVQALIARGVIGDFRDPDIARFGFPPLYVRYQDVWDAVEILREVLETRAYDRPEFRARAAVT